MSAPEFSRRPYIVRSRLMAGILFATASLVPQAAMPESQNRFDFKQLKPDDKISGQILCTYMILITVQAMVAECKLPRKHIDGAIDRGIGTLEYFIITNSSQHPTQETFNIQKRHTADWYSENVKKLPPEICGGKALDNWPRSATPEEFDAGIKTILQTPPKPGNVPCL